MNRMLRKELVSNKVFLIALPVAIILYSVILQSGPYVPFMFAAFMGTALPASSVDIDDKTGWSRFAVSSGISRKTIVNSKFLISLVSLAICQAVAFVGAMLIVLIWGGELVLEDAFLVIALAVCLGMVLSSAALYIGYRFKGVAFFIVFLILGFIVMVILFGMQKIVGIFSDNMLATVAVCGGSLLAAALLYVLTLRTVESRDF
ncbi:MAG: ABC-2 transporter permease [Candidatus Methanomethylophilaceae archaeon]|jgi:ABC-type transport system involved in multi-copper enzyme maturation permease subunit|nr:ABC-2 transporter permease [Candidatus Methanomethylophilaceae archaeon]